MASVKINKQEQMAKATIYDIPEDQLRERLAHDPIRTLVRMIDDRLSPMAERATRATAECKSDTGRRIAQVSPVVGLSLLLFLALLPLMILYNSNQDWWWLILHGGPLLAVSALAAMGFSVSAILYQHFSR